MMGVVLAAGEGDRLGGLYPKPYTPVHDIPVVSRLLVGLKHCDPIVLICRRQDQKLARSAVQTVGMKDAVEIIAQDPMPPAQRIYRIQVEQWERDDRMLIVLGDNVYLPSPREPLSLMSSVPLQPNQAAVLTQPIEHTHGLHVVNGYVEKRASDVRPFDIGIYALGPEVPGIQLSTDGSLLSAIVNTCATRAVAPPERLLWYDIGTNDDLAAADLAVRAWERGES